MNRLLVLALVAGCSARSAKPAPVAAKATDRPLLLWKVQKGGATSHLLGTCHLPIPLDHALPDETVLTDARVLYTELRVADVQGGDALGAMWSDAALSDAIGPEAWLATSHALRKAMPASALNHLKGWAAYSLLTVFKDQDLFAKIQDAVSGEGTPGDPVLDMAVEQAANTAGIEHRALETAGEQFAILDEYDETFLDALKRLPEQTDADAQTSAAMARACFQSDVDALNLALDDDSYSDMMTGLLDDRNARWIANLRPEIEQGGVLVATGAAHMVGESGLIAAFEAEGWTVTQQYGPTSTWTPPDVDLGTAGIEVPDVAPEVLDAYASLVDSTAAMVCSPDSPVALCMIPDNEACIERMRTDVALCLEQIAPDLPADPTQMPLETGSMLMGCASSGVTLESMITGSMGDAPVCQMMKAALDQAQQAVSP